MKRLNELYEKYSVILKFAVFFGPLIFAIWKYVGSYIQMPEEVEYLKHRTEILIQDSINNELRNHKQDSAIHTLYIWANQDYDSITYITKQLRTKPKR